MLPGPIFIYKCPKCYNQIYNKSTASGNTFGSKLYSDGKTISPNFPNFPDITKCLKCETIFWLEKENEYKIYNYSGSLIEMLKDIDKAEFLTLYEYVETLDTQIIKSENDERIIRHRIWWCFNDRVRKGMPLYSAEYDKELWNNNILRLVELLNDNNINQKISKAELYRNLGDFEKCQAILNSIEVSKYDWLKDIFYKECNKKNTQVFELSASDLLI